MLGLVGAHSLLLRHDPDPGLLEVVLKNLDGMMPGHPDVLALRWLAATRLAGSAGGGAAPATAGDATAESAGGGAAAATAVGAKADSARDAVAASVPEGGAAWPPMLLPSYRALIDMDAAYPSAIADGSVAERAAANLVVQGIWTSWVPLPRRRTMRGGERSQRRVSIAGILPALAEDPSLIDRVSLTDPATTRVAAYLGALAALEGPAGRAERFASLSPQEIGLATTLPAATVERALAGIATAVAPPGGGGRQAASPGGRDFGTITTDKRQ
jgi:hypothetical protein